jgi:hypothetical protein
MFLIRPRSSEAFEGDTVIIMCEVIGDPKPEVLWLRDFLKVSQLLIHVICSMTFLNTKVNYEKKSEKLA